MKVSHYKYYIFWVLAIVPLWESCQKMDAVSYSLGPQTFIEVTHETEVCFSDFLEDVRETGYLDGSDILSKTIGWVDDALAKRRAKVYAIKYRTVDPYGNEVEASGTIYFPLNYKIKGVTEIAPISYMQKTSGASDRIPATEAMHTMFGYVVIMPDFIGYGTTKDSHYYTFLDPENNGRVGYDMRQAAREFLATKGYKLPDRTLLAGYSLGGSSALAMLKYYELHGKNVKVERATLGCGCLDPSIAFREFAHTGVSGYPSIPTIIYSKNRYHNLGLDFSKIFSGELLEHYEEWLDRSAAHDVVFLRRVLGQDMHTYMHPDFFTEAKNSEFKKVYDVMAGCSHVDGWTPKAKLYIYAATDDTVVPFECSRYAYEQFKSRGADVVMYSGTGGHNGYAAQMLVGFYLYLLAK